MIRLYRTLWLLSALLPACSDGSHEGDAFDGFDGIPHVTDAETVGFDAPDLGLDVPGADEVGADETGGAFPDASATCDEMARFLLDYVAAHGDCSGGETCVPAVPVRGESPCNPAWIQFDAPASSLSAVTADAATHGLLRFLDLAVDQCCLGYYPSGSGDGWRCGWAVDMGMDFSAVCSDGTCIGRRTPDPSGCGRDGGAGGGDG